MTGSQLLDELMDLSTEDLEKEVEMVVDCDGREGGDVVKRIGVSEIRINLYES